MRSKWGFGDAEVVKQVRERTSGAKSEHERERETDGENKRVSVGQHRDLKRQAGFKFETGREFGERPNE